VTLVRELFDKALGAKVFEASCSDPALGRGLDGFWGAFGGRPSFQVPPSHAKRDCGDGA
jgi:hypothetical protein